MERPDQTDRAAQSERRPRPSGSRSEPTLPEAPGRKESAKIPPPEQPATPQCSPSSPGRAESPRHPQGIASAMARKKRSFQNTQSRPRTISVSSEECCQSLEFFLTRGVDLCSQGTSFLFSCFQCVSSGNSPVPPEEKVANIVLYRRNVY
nr:hypothetical protein [uncultured bacterium]